MNKANHANVIHLASGDNVVVACEQICAGATIEVDGKPVTVLDSVELGHKIACQDILVDDKIMKYGAPIGRANKPIASGGHVHIHNIESDYLHSHTGRQDEGEIA